VSRLGITRYTTRTLHGSTLHTHLSAASARPDGVRAYRSAACSGKLYLPR